MNLQFFGKSLSIKIQFVRASVTIEPGRSLLTIRYLELFDTTSSHRKLHHGNFIRMKCTPSPALNFLQAVPSLLRIPL